MARRIGIPEILLVLGLLVGAPGFVYPQLVLANSTVGLLIGFAPMIGLFGYAAYWGLTIRKGLASSLYRNQALGVSLLSLAWGLYAVRNLASMTIFANNNF